MKNFIVMSTIVITCFVVQPILIANDIYINDGGTYVINDSTYQNDSIILDDTPESPYWPGTHIKLIDAGVIGMDLLAFNYSIITMPRGTIGGNIYTHDDTRTNVYGGNFGSLHTYNNAFIHLGGSNFEVNGQSLSDGDKLSDYGTLIEEGQDPNVTDYYTGTIIGTLADGSAINSEFRIYKIGKYQGISDIYIQDRCFFRVAGDLDYNCKVDLLDLAQMAYNWMVDCYWEPENPECEYFAPPPIPGGATGPPPVPGGATG